MPLNDAALVLARFVCMSRAVVRLAALPVVFWFSVGKVQLAKLPLLGVPNAPPLVTIAPALPTFTANAVVTPVPGVVVARDVRPRLVRAVAALVRSPKLLDFTIRPLRS